MSIKQQIQDAMKDAMRAKETERLECLRMAKAALLLKEKEGAGPVTDDIAIAALRAEVKKRHQSLETYQELGKIEQVDALKREIACIEAFLPKQLNEEELVARVQAYLSAHPEINHAGKLTGALKKELGDQVDGRMLNEVCKRALEGE
jgi:uncharacterized protein